MLVLKGELVLVGQGHVENCRICIFGQGLVWRELVTRGERV